MSTLQKALVLGILLVSAAYFTIYLKGDQRATEWDASGPPQTELKVLKRTIYYIDNNYVDPDRIAAHELLKSGLNALQQRLAPVMLNWDDDLIIEVGDAKRRFTIPENLAVNDLPHLFAHIVDFVTSEIPQEEDEEEENMEYLILSGLVSSLDPHSAFLRPKVYSEFKIGTSGNFGGIGIAIGIREGNLTVIAPLEGTPAYRAGLKAEDHIIQINDEPTINMSLTEAVEKLRGQIGTTVSILVRRQEQKDPLEFSLRRALIVIDSVNGELLPQTRVALMKIKSFQEDTLSEFVRYLDLLSKEAEGLSGIILDLRNNPGGLLDQAVAVTDVLLDNGIIVSTVGFNRQLNEKDRAQANNGFESLPVVVLVNQGSASASEILAGALQIHNRGLIVGNQTFGKGSVQTVYDLKDGSALKLTIAKYLAAGTEDVQTFGIVPDLATFPTVISDERVDLIENDSRRERDLEKHLQQGEMAESKDPVAKIHYLEKLDKDEEVTGRIRLKHDFPVQLAAGILEATRGSSRQDLLAAVTAVTAVLQSDEESKIADSFAKQNIDWGIGESGGKPEVKVSFWMSQGDKKVDEIIGGEEVKLHIKVSNEGEGPLYRMIGISKSDNPFFHDLEFPLGRIDPGKSASYAVPIKIPASIPSQLLPLEIRFQNYLNHETGTRTFPVAVRSAPLPHFAYEWRLSNGTQAEPGATVDLAFTIENLGPGRSEETVLNLVNREGKHVYIKDGRARLEPMEPGSRQEAVLSMRLRDDFDQMKARLTVSVEDHRTGYALQDKLNLSLNGGIHEPPVANMQRPPQMKLSLPEKPYWTKQRKYKFSGQASDDERIQEIYAFVNESKIFYSANPAMNGDPFPFNVTVPLEDGANRITIIAKDNADLIARQQWIVWKES